MIHHAIEEQYFLEVADEWNLAVLYQNLADVKQTNISRKAKLSPVEKAMLRGLLAGHSPKTIANELHWTSASVGVELSKGIYRYVEAMTDRESNTLNSWRDIARWLKEAGYQAKIQADRVLINGKELPEVNQFYGRERELNQLQKWMTGDRYRLVLLSGTIGIGKTTLAARLTQTIKSDFERIIWRNLKYQPSLFHILVEILDSFAPRKNHGDSTIDINSLITQLIEYLRQYRCLLILDGLENIMSANSFAGFYQNEHHVYSQFIRRIAEENHQSCLLITSRDEPIDMPLLQNSKSDLLNLKGLGEAGTNIFINYNLSSSQSYKGLIDCYSGNPLALKLISAIIKDLFDGDISRFSTASHKRELEFMPLYFKKLLEAQIKQISKLEIKTLCCLAKKSRPLCFEYLQNNISFESKIYNFIQVLSSLKRRSFLDISWQDDKTYFTLPKIIEKYIANKYYDDRHLRIISNISI